MPEEIDNTAETVEESTVDTIIEQGEAGDQNTEEKKDGDGKNADEGVKTPETKEELQEVEDEEPQVRTRKTVKDFIIERQKRKIEKLQGKTEEENEDEEDVNEDEEYDDILPQDEKLIKKVAGKMIAPLIENQLAKDDENEVQKFLAENPDFKPYEAKVKKFMVHPSRRQLPVESIFYEVAGPDLMKIGAKRAKEADEEAQRSNAGGGSARGAEDVRVDWANMSLEEFSKRKEEIRQRNRY